MDHTQQSPGTLNSEEQALLQGIAGFFNKPYDQMSFTYVAAGNGAGELETATSKMLGVQVQVLTLAYNANNDLIDAIVV